MANRTSDLVCPWCQQKIIATLDAFGEHLTSCSAAPADAAAHNEATMTGLRHQDDLHRKYRIAEHEPGTASPSPA